MGGIIVWPKDSDPSTSSNIWLECNGQTFDTNRFKKLYKVLGTNKVPNFQGMFLRGAGSQNFEQYNGFKYGETSTTYSSGAVGEIQGDASRLLWAHSDAATVSIDKNATSMRVLNGYSSEWASNYTDLENAWAHFVGNSHYGTFMNPISIWFSTNPKHYRYRLNGSGGDYAYYNLSEYTTAAESDEGLRVNFWATDMGFTNQLVMPVDNEIRPVNMAVKYYIRAK